MATYKAAAAPVHPILWDARPDRVATCPVCADARPKPFVLSTTQAWTGAGFLDLVSCPGCCCKFFPELKSVEYQTPGDVSKYIKFYVETGAGLDIVVSPLSAVPTKPGDRYLEVGCGYGFALDFAARALGLSVEGVDPSPYAAAGQKALGYRLNAGYLDHATKLHHDQFELVGATEVLEHIFDPVPFLRILRERLTPGGVLMLTTPNAASARKGTALGALLPLLSPGWHTVLYSPEAITHVLKAAGFKTVRTAVDHHTLYAAATNGTAPIQLKARAEPKLFDRYLVERSAAVEPDSPLHIGLLYRLMKHRANLGQYSEALSVFEELRTRLKRIYGFDIADGNASWLAGRATETFSDFAGRYPMCLTGIAYFRGIIAMNHERNYVTAEHYFTLAADYGAKLRAVLQSMGADDGETEELARRGKMLARMALVYRSPAEALRRLFGRAPRGYDVPGFAEEPDASPDEMADLFAQFVALGAFDEAETLVGSVEAYLRSPPAEDVGDEDVQRRIATHRAFGFYHVQKHQAGRRATRHLAAAERLLMRQVSEAANGTAEQKRWAMRTERVIGWLLRGRLSTAEHVARPLLAAADRGEVDEATLTRLAALKPQLQQAA